MKLFLFSLFILLSCYKSVAADLDTSLIILQKHCASERQRLGLIYPKIEKTKIKWSKKTLSDGRIQVRIDHAPINNLTSAHFFWWMKNLTTSLPGGLTDCSNYSLLGNDFFIANNLTAKGSNLEVSMNSRIETTRVINKISSQILFKEVYKIVQFDAHSIRLVREENIMGLGETIMVQTEIQSHERNSGLNLTTIITIGGTSENHPQVMKTLNQVFIAHEFSDEQIELQVQQQAQSMLNLQTLIPWLKAHWLQYRSR